MLTDYFIVIDPSWRAVYRNTKQFVTCIIQRIIEQFTVVKTDLFHLISYYYCPPITLIHINNT